jgi:phosphoribosylformylglycinamidine synthase II
VTFASAELTEESEEVSRPSVQIANPIEEEKLKRALIEIRDLCLGSSTTDLGGGGLSSAIGETAGKYHCGAIIDLDKVPLKYPEIAPWEIYVSESQERMLLTVAPKDVKQVLAIFREEEVEATVIGTLTSDDVLRIHFNGQEVASIDIPFLFDPPRLIKIARYEPQTMREPETSEPDNLSEMLLRLLSSPNIASKESVIRTYDHEVKGNTVLKPLQGVHGGPNDSAVLKPLDDSWKGIVVSCGMNPNYGKIDPYWMAASAIDEAIRNNIAVGGRRIALLDNFTWGSPERPERLGSLVKACEACYDFAVAYGTPFISGKDSLYNESPLGAVTPTLLITALGIIPDVRCAVSMDAKTPNDSIYIIGKTFKELGGSEYYRLKGIIGKTVPHVRKKEARITFTAITKAIDSGLIAACHDLSDGGLAVAAAEMAFAGGCGIELDLQKVLYDGPRRDDFVLFSESNTRFLVEISTEHKTRFESTMKGVFFEEVGKTTKSPMLSIKGLRNEVVVNLPLTSLMASWKGTLSREA